MMAGTVRVAPLFLLLPSRYTSTPISRTHHKSVSARIRTLHGPRTQLCNHNRIFTSKFRSMVISSYERSLNNEDSIELERWRKGGGLFHVSADIDATAFIEAGAIVHAHAKVGSNVHLGSGTVVGPSVHVGSSTRTGYNVSLQNCSIGDFCIIHNGVCIGQDGFGHFVDEQGKMVKKPQLLYAKIGKHVEIGANACIDRGSWRDTVIGDHTKIDNLVQIGHNVVIGSFCMLCAQVGIAGSVTIGDYVVMGGQAGVSDHVSIASKVRLAGRSGVTKNIVEPGDYGGFPAVPVYDWRRSVVALRKLSQHNNS